MATRAARPAKLFHVPSMHHAAIAFVAWELCPFARGWLELQEAGGWPRLPVTWSTYVRAVLLVVVVQEDICAATRPVNHVIKSTAFQTSLGFDLKTQIPTCFSFIDNQAYLITEVFHARIKKKKWFHVFIFSCISLCMYLCMYVLRYIIAYRCYIVTYIVTKHFDIGIHDSRFELCLFGICCIAIINQNLLLYKINIKWTRALTQTFNHRHLKIIVKI